MSSCDAVIAPLIAAGDLHAARFAALRSLPPPPPPSMAFQSARRNTDNSRTAYWDTCKQPWLKRMDELLALPDALSRISDAHKKYHYSDEHIVSTASESCRHAEWDAACCSMLGSDEDGTPCNHECCALGVKSPRTALSLPLLREPSVRLVLADDIKLTIEQDGFLRPFDVATVLWPAGYLLARWASDQGRQARLWPKEMCATKAMRAIELGTGTGAAAIAASTSKATPFEYVVASDHALRSLALATANAAMNGVDETVRAHRVDWNDDETIADAVRAHGTFDLVMGASLQFETWAARRWPVLRNLTHPGSIVALSHTLGALTTTTSAEEEEEDSGFAEVERISGLEYGLPTRWSETETDFEVVLLRRL